MLIDARTIARSPAPCSNCHMPYLHRHACQPAQWIARSLEDSPAQYLAGNPEETARRQEEK